MKSTIHELQKKKIFRVSKKSVQLFFAFAFTLSGFSQNLPCDYLFTDSGGVNGNYFNNENQTVVIYPSIPGEMVSVTFTQFDLEAINDKMNIYDGNSTQSTLIASNNPNGAFWGNTIPGPFTATNPSGCLTFVFISNSTVTRLGWVANAEGCGSTGFKLKAFFDNNGNGDQDSGEVNFPNGGFNYQKNSEPINYQSSNQGTGFVPENNPSNIYNFNYVLNPDYVNYFNITNTNFNNLSIGIIPSLVNLNFPITATNNLIDLNVNLTPTSLPTAGFNHINKVSYTNRGNLPIANGTISFTKDIATTIFSTSENVNNTTTGFTYDFTNLLPFETRNINVVLSVPSIPSVSIGQLLSNSVSISTSAVETILTNNSSNLTEAIAASYDPNDITESHGEKILFSSFNANDYLNYTIRFENTGTAFAQNVNITNILDTKIDENSVQIVASSNECVLNRAGKYLDFKFKNIFLPVSVANTVIGKGFVTYKAKLKSGFNVGTIIPNAAKIYFDTNPAIDTNIFETEFTSLLTNSTFDYNDFVKVYPNPAKNTINIETQLDNNIESISISNLLGQLFLEINQSNLKTIDVSQLQNGSYIMKIKSNFGFSNVKFIKE